jgi:hypothetical protein
VYFLAVLQRNRNVLALNTASDNLHVKVLSVRWASDIMNISFTFPLNIKVIHTAKNMLLTLKKFHSPNTLINNGVQTHAALV